MYNFISTFEELNKLYEEFTPDVEKEEAGKEEAEKEEVEAGCNEELAEAVEAEVEEAEISVDEESDIEPEEPVVEEEPRQLICECDKCGALVIKAEADIVIDDESDLVNIEDECQFCDEANGFKIVGVVAPYEAEADVEVEVVEDEVVEEGLLDLEMPISANVNVKA